MANDKEEADRIFAALSKDGKETMPIANAPWGPYFGITNEWHVICVYC